MIFYDATLMTEPFFITAMLALLLLGLRLAGWPKATRSCRQAGTGRQKMGGNGAVLGAVVGAATLLRQTVLLWIPFQIIWMNWASYRQFHKWRPAILGSLITLSVAAIFVLPWTMRNYAVYDAFLPLNSNAGYALYSANHPDHGTRFDQDYAAPLPVDLLQQDMDEAQWNTSLTLRGLEFIRQDPVRYLRLTASKAGVHFNFWFSAESSLSSNLMRVLSFGIYLPFFIAGLVLSFKDWKRCSIIYLFVILFNLLHILTWSGIRYRLPVDAALMPFAGLALVSIFAWMKKIKLIPKGGVRATPPVGINIHNPEVDLKALVTGGAGMIGSHIVDLLIEKGHQARILDNLAKPTHLRDCRDGSIPRQNSSRGMSAHGKI